MCSHGVSPPHSKCKQGSQKRQTLSTFLAKMAEMPICLDTAARRAGCKLRTLSFLSIHWGVLPGSFMWLSSSRAQVVIFSAWSMYKYFHKVPNCCLMGRLHNQHAANVAARLTCSLGKSELPKPGMTVCTSVTVPSGRGEDRALLDGYSREVLCHC